MVIFQLGLCRSNQSVACPPGGADVKPPDRLVSRSPVETDVRGQNLLASHSLVEAELMQPMTEVTWMRMTMMMMSPRTPTRSTYICPHSAGVSCQGNDQFDWRSRWHLVEDPGVVWMEGDGVRVL